MGNEEQARYWGEEAGPIWVELQDRFDAITGPFGELALSAAAVAPGLRGGARVAFVCWQGPDSNAWLVEPLRALVGILDLPPPRGPEDPSPLSLGDPARIEALLGDAGFVDVSIADAPGTVRLAAAAEMERSADIALQLGPAWLPYQRASEEARARAREAVDAVISPHRGPDGVVMPAACWVVTARTR